jgi:hypothetical protein
MAIERDAATPPALPTFGYETWQCRCGQVLGLVFRGWLYQTHKGRRTTSRLPARVQCEKCGRPSLRGA